MAAHQGLAEGWPCSMPLREVLEQLFSGWRSRRQCAAARPWACGSSCRCPVPSPANSQPEALAGKLPPLGRVGQVNDVVDGILYLESAPDERRGPAHRRPNRRSLSRPMPTELVLLVTAGRRCPWASRAGTSPAVVVRSATALACDIQTGPRRADWRRSRQASSVGDGLCPAVEILDKPASAALWARTRRRAG